jgi:hypothetical protein
MIRIVSMRLVPAVGTSICAVLQAETNWKISLGSPYRLLTGNIASTGGCRRGSSQIGDNQSQIN